MSEVETEIQQENAPDERPDWLPSNFERPEDLAKSYTHSVSKITEQGQELAALRSQIEEIQASQHTQQDQVRSSDIEQQLYDAYESGDGRAIAAANAFLIEQSQKQLRAELAAQTAKPSAPTEIVAAYAEQQISGKYSDWSELRAKVGEVIGATPYLRDAIAGESSPAKVAEYLDAAYKLAKYETGQVVTADAAKALDELNRQTKQSAQTMSGTNSAQEAESYWDMVKAAKSGPPRISLS